MAKVSAIIESGKYQGYFGKGNYCESLNLFWLEVSLSPSSPVEHRGFFRPEQISSVAPPARSSILEENKELKLQNGVMLVGRKCSCASSWCPDCFVKKGGAEKIAQRISLLEWKSTRHVVLTIDRKKFGYDGQKAFEFVKDKKKIAQLIHNLKRTQDITITNWVWVLEWHKDGFPHWHLFIDVNVTGKAGMIGGDTLRQYWDIGGVREMPIVTKKHWKYLTGYLGKLGYLEKGKSHQAILPDWAMMQAYKIRRTGSMRLKKGKKGLGYDQEVILKEEEEKGEVKREVIQKTYAEKLGSCGQAVMVEVTRNHKTSYWLKMKLAWAEFKKIFGDYIQGKGYQVTMSFDDFNMLMAVCNQ